MADNFGWKYISVGSLLKQQVDRKTELGQKIHTAWKEHRYGKSDSNVTVVVKD